jgi:hypothetical protein
MNYHLRVSQLHGFVREADTHCSRLEELVPPIENLAELKIETVELLLSLVNAANAVTRLLEGIDLQLRERAGDKR